jgi:triosephosphate isomerase (TIM)
MRRQVIAGNWKMNKTIGEARELCQSLLSALGGITSTGGPEVLVCPPYTALFAARETLDGSGIGLGAQDVFWKPWGAFTGQVSVPMLKDAGCTHVIIGHSERRGRFGVPDEEFTDEVLAYFGESDRTVNLKVIAALAGGLIPIVCCGELLVERRDGRTDEVVRRQIEEGLAELTPKQAVGIILAYEPVWAIGTGEVCAAGEANRVCGVIRQTIADRFGPRAAEAVRIQYGGSVKPDNAAELLSQEHIDGALVGGASLKAADFTAIIQAAPA